MCSPVCKTTASQVTKTNSHIRFTIDTAIVISVVPAAEEQLHKWTTTVTMNDDVALLLSFSTSTSHYLFYSIVLKKLNEK